MAETDKTSEIDRLTGALTQAAVEAAAEAALTAAASGEIVAIGYIGIDHFPLLRETYGSLVTDHFLRDIASRIREALRPQDAVGRYGREEFMVVFRGLSTKFETLALASKIRTHIAEPIRAGAGEEVLSPGCGVAQYPANGKTVDALRAHAEKSMRTLLVAMRSQAVAAAQEQINKARAAVDAAQAALEAAEAHYEEAVALVAASEVAATGAAPEGTPPATS